MDLQLPDVLNGAPLDAQLWHNPLAAAVQRHEDKLAGTAQLLLPKIKAADQPVSGTSLQDDNHLVDAIEANARYQLFVEATHNSPAAGDLRLNFSFPAGTTGLLSGLDGTIPFAGVALGTDLNYAGTGATAYLRIFGQITTGANAGNLRLRLCQQAASGSSILQANSYWYLTRIA